MDTSPGPVLIKKIPDMPSEYLALAPLCLGPADSPRGVQCQGCVVIKSPLPARAGERGWQGALLLVVIGLPAHGQTSGPAEVTQGWVNRFTLLLQDGHLPHQVELAWL